VREFTESILHISYV